jgi:NAD(P)-binding Rossmann-like domain
MTSQSNNELNTAQPTALAETDPQKVASEWFQSFVKNISAGNVDGIVNLFVEDAYWRDILSLTWDFRTFIRVPRIRQFLQDRLENVHLKSLNLNVDTIALQKPYPDITWIMAMFRFETDVGLGMGIFRLIPTAGGEWKTHCMFTNLEDLKHFPEKIGGLRNPEPSHCDWEKNRQREIEFEDTNPAVLIVGGGQGGLAIAARLKVLDVSNLIIEKHPRVGDSWRKRYEAMCLHDPVCKP